MIFNVECFNTFGVVKRLCAINVLAFTMMWCTCYFIWTVWMGYNHPLPFVGYICAQTTSYIYHHIGLWFQFPLELRSDKEVRKRFCWYMGYKYYQILHGFQLLAMKVLMIQLPSEMQWIMGILFPLQREFGFWIYVQCLNKSTD